jgi:predicted  nucleic acid-binding Zn-ribbon protein
MQLHSSSEVILARKQLTIIEQAYQDKDCDTDILSASIEELMNIYHKSKAAKFELEETLKKLRVGFETVQAALKALDPSSERTEFRAVQVRVVAISGEIDDFERRLAAVNMQFSSVQDSAQKALRLFGLMLSKKELQWA